METSDIARDYVSVRAILAEARLLTIAGVAELLGMSEYRVKKLRARRRDRDNVDGVEYRPRSDALPRPLPLPVGPVWHQAEIVEWAMQTGRMDSTGRPTRPRPPGRAVRTA